jgi:hypothetical protein
MNSFKTLSCMLLIFTFSCFAQADVEIEAGRSTSSARVSLTGDEANSFFDFFSVEETIIRQCLKSSNSCTNCRTTCLKFGDKPVKITKSSGAVECEKDLEKRTSSCRLAIEDNQDLELYAGLPILVNADKNELGRALGSKNRFDFADAFSFYCTALVPDRYYDCFMQVSISESNVRLSTSKPGLHIFQGDDLIKNNRILISGNSNGLQSKASKLYNALKESSRDARVGAERDNVLSVQLYKASQTYAVSIQELKGTVVERGVEGDKFYTLTQLDEATVLNIKNSIKPDRLDILTNGKSIFGNLLESDKYKIEFSSDLDSATLKVIF